MKARAEKTDKADAQALAEMLACGRYSEVPVKRSPCGASGEPSIEGVADGARPVGERPDAALRPDPRPAAPLRREHLERSGSKGFAAAVRMACRREEVLYTTVSALLAALEAVAAQIAALDRTVGEIVRGSPVCRLLTSVPGVGAVTAPTFMATVEDPRRFGRSRSLGAHVGLTPRRSQSGARDVTGSISRPGGRSVAAPSLRGGEPPADHGATAVGTAQPRAAAHEADRAEEGPYRGGPQAGGAAHRTLETRRGLRGHAGPTKAGPSRGG